MKVVFKKMALCPFAFIVLAISARAQKEIYRSDHDDLPYYFGLTLGYNSSFLHPTKSAKFLQKDINNQDSILVAEPGASGGVTLGLLATARLTNHLQVRFNPQLIIGGAKYFNYTLGAARDENEEVNQRRTLPSTIVSFPLQIKLNSDRIGNFRTYLLGGIKYDYDLSSNSSARNAEDMIKLNKSDFGLEAGIGCNFFLPFVTISPEIKVGYGLTNIHNRDVNLKYSSVFDAIYSRMIMFSLHFED
jgi:hypothetical protein